MKIILDLQARQSKGSYYRGIGRYTLAFSQALARQAGEHEVHLLTNAALPDYVHEIRRDFADYIPVQRIHAFSIPTPVAGLEQANAWRMRVAEHLREYAALHLQPDIFHVSSLFEGMGDDIVTSVDHPRLADKTSVTLHDLIPLVQPGEYWSEPVRRAWYYRKLQALKNAGLHLAVSEYSKQEGIRLLSLDPERVFTIYNAIADTFRPLELDSVQQQVLKAKFAIKRQFILYAGGVEQRKNVDALLKAYVVLPDALRQQYQLVIAGELQDWQRQFLHKVAKSQAIPDLCITGLLTDDELIGLYNMATLFVFPSLYEGFGLPVLEAMACGTPTLCADNTSLPEVIGYKEALFDANKVESIASKMHQALTDTGFRQNLREHGLCQSKKFSWDASASRALAIFAEYQARQRPPTHTWLRGSQQVRQRLAFVFSVQDISATRFAQWLLPALARHYQVDLVLLDDGAVDFWLTANCPRRTVVWLQKHPNYYQRRVYLLGQQPGFQILENLLREQPGILLLLESLQSITLLHDSLGVITTHTEIKEQMQVNYGLLDMRYWRIMNTGQDNKGNGCNYANCAVGEHFYHQVEELYAHHPLAYEQSLLEDIEQWSAITGQVNHDWFAVAESIVSNRIVSPQVRKLRTLFYDVSVLAHVDNASGIHRVTRNILLELFQQPPAGFRIEPAYAQGGRYHYARQFTHVFLGKKLGLHDDVVEFQPGDVLLVIDLGLDFAVEMEAYLQFIRARGVQLYYLVHDILALRLPCAYFDDGIYRLMPLWVGAISRMADGLICTTQAVKQDLEQWLHEHPPLRSVPLRLGVCALGADIHVPAETEQLDSSQQQLLVSLARYPCILMVSTIEPRKGYSQALDAFEQLWRMGLDINLVIVGKHGWNVDKLIGRLETHPEQGRRLHWLKFVSDAMLNALYKQSHALLMASEGEGFGLPLIEAAQHGLPVIARGIPVFRELGGEHAFYFDGLDGQSLAYAIQEWLGLLEQGQAPQPQGIRRITWQESANSIKSFLADGDIYTQGVAVV